MIFISHQWNGFRHPDPNGVQLEDMVKIFRRLRDGAIDRVEMDPFHTILYKTNHVTHKAEWMQLLSNAYLWYDFWSQPQPFMASDKSKFHELQRDMSRAISSLAAYVERADCVVILAPGTIHNDKVDPKTRRKVYTCYRTFRRRAFCFLEMFATMLSRRKTHPMLHVQSSVDVPRWVSPLGTFEIRTDVYDVIVVRNNSIEFCCHER